MSETPTPEQVFKGYASRIAADWTKRNLSEQTEEVSEELIDKFAYLARLIVSHCGESGQTTHALNKLRESQMWAIHSLERSGT